MLPVRALTGGLGPLLALWVVVAGCSLDKDETPRNRCRQAGDCLGGRLCLAGICVDPGGPATAEECRAGCSQLATLCGPPPEDCEEGCLMAFTPSAAIQCALAATTCAEAGACGAPAGSGSELASPGECVAACARLEAICGENELACADACVEARTLAAVAGCVADAVSCEDALACEAPFTEGLPQ